MESDKTIIGYRLRHPNSNRHYIGITSQICQERLTRHLNDKENNKRTAWIKGHADERDLFYMEPFFYTTDLTLAKRLEMYWIAEDRKQYGIENIMNGTDGGDGTVGHITSKETRKKLSDSKKGEKHPNFGKHHSPETLKKMSDAWIGRTPRIGWQHSEKTKQRMSESAKGKPKSVESRLKMSQAKKGKKSSRKGIPNSIEANNRCAQTKSKFNIIQIREILKMIANGIPQIDIAKIFNVTPATISNIKNKKGNFYSKLMENYNGDK